MEIRYILATLIYFLVSIFYLQTYLDVFVDAASLDFIMDNTFVVNASILSSSSFIKEINPGDNSFEMKLELVAISEIEAFG